MKTIARVSDSELGVAAVDVVTGEFPVIAKIFAIRSTISALAVRPAEPRDSDTVAGLEFRFLIFDFRINGIADFFDAPDDLVAENERKFRIRQFAIDDMKIGPANGAHVDANKKLSPARFRLAEIAERERLSDLFQHHRAHGDVSTARGLKATSDALRKELVCFL